MLRTIFERLKEPYHLIVAQVCKRFLAIIEEYFPGAGLSQKFYLANEKYIFMTEIVVICGCELFITAPNIINLFYRYGEISYLDDLEFKIEFTKDGGAFRIIAARVKPHPLLFCCSERLKCEIINNNSNRAIKYLRYLRNEFKYEYFASKYFNTYLYHGMVANDYYVLKISDKFSLEIL